jgi:cytochrome c oxidase subunit 3
MTSLLGAGFLASQLVVWRQLVKQGIYIATNPHSSFFYLLTATHGFHLACGLLALIYLLLRYLKRPSGDLAIHRQVAVTDAAAIYWHFMDALWIYLFLLLFLWR